MRQHVPGKVNPAALQVALKNLLTAALMPSWGVYTTSLPPLSRRP
jgi:hypothetical protein